MVFVEPTNRGVLGLKGLHLYKTAIFDWRTLKWDY